MPRVPAKEVDAGRAQRHVSWLVHDQGMPRKAVARRAKTVQRTVQDLLAGRRNLIGGDLERRLLAVKFDPAAGANGRYAADDQRMLKALNWQGYNNRSIAAGVGSHEKTIGRIISGQESVTYILHRRIKSYYARHWAFDGGDERARRRAEREGYAPPKELEGGPVEHGTMAAYRRGCHCDECRTANAKRKALRELRGLQGEAPDVTDAEPARLHAKMRMRQGMPLAAIARKAGVSHDYMVRLVYGRRGHVTQTIPSEQDERIRNVEFDPAYTKNGRRDPTGSMRRLQALVLARHDVQDIIAGTGVGSNSISRILNGRIVWVSEDTYQRIRRFYEANWHRDGGSAAARRRAIRGHRANPDHFLPAAAWSEFSIDDPRAKPRGVDERIYEEAVC